MIYPLKFLPLYKQVIWGGNRLKDYGFNYDPLPNCGSAASKEGNPGGRTVPGEKTERCRGRSESRCAATAKEVVRPTGQYSSFENCPVGPVPDYLLII